MHICGIGGHKQASIHMHVHMHVRNAVLQVWDLLRLILIRPLFVEWQFLTSDFP